MCFAPESGAVYTAPKIGAMPRFRKSIYSREWKELTGWLVQQRKQAALSQRQLAARVGVVHSLVGKVEQGERRLDPIELVLYCNGMGADPCELLRVIQSHMTADDA